MNIERKWAGRWINAGSTMGTPVASILPAPYLRKTFICGKTPQQATIFLCGLGWHVLYVNNQKADDRVLAPNQTQYDKHASFIAYDVTKLLKKGKNAVTVLLGNGLFNCPEPKWSFDKAPWRDNPKMLCDIVVDNEVVAKSDCSWKVHNSPITFDGFRNGQYYDARLEVPGFADPDLDDSAWMYQYLAGIKPQITTPGFKKFVIQPAFVQKLDWVKANYKSPYGVISSQWQRQDGKMICRFEIPSGSTADIILPGKTLRDATGTVKEILL